MKYDKWAISAVCVVLGMMLVIQFRSTQSIMQNDLRVQRTGDLALQLENMERQRDALEQKLQELQEDGTKSSLKKENEQLRFQAGLTPVEGKGIIVRIEDSKLPVKSGENPNLYLIHDEDILRIINELRAAGAEAISINDQRLIGTTEVRCVGPTITVNRKSFAPPYIVQAIGDPNSLAGALQMRGGVADTLKHWGIDLGITKSEHIVVPAYNSPPRNEFSKAVTGGDGQ